MASGNVALGQKEKKKYAENKNNQHKKPKGYKVK